MFIFFSDYEAQQKQHQQMLQQQQQQQKQQQLAQKQAEIAAAQAPQVMPQPAISVFNFFKKFSLFILLNLINNYVI